MSLGSTRSPQAAEPAARTPRAALAQPVVLGPLGELIGFHLARATVTSDAAFDRHIAPLQLRKVELSLLMLLRANGELAPKQLCAALALVAPALTPLLDKLQDRGLIRRQRNPNDGRSQRILLSDKGRRLAEDCEQLSARMEAELCASLTSAEHAMLVELLCRFAGHAPSAR